LPRYAVALLIALAVTGCKRHTEKPVRPSIGAACTDEGKMHCTSPSEVLVCVDGKYESMPCRDSKCSGGSMGDICANTTFLPGEYCTVNSAIDDFWKHDCSVDGKSQLQCVGKHWAFEKKCPGKYGCRRTDKRVGRRGGWRSILTCDETSTDEGAACETENQYACASDFATTVRCAGGKWQRDQICRGPAGCREVESKVRCDDTLAKVGDPCVEDGDQACSTDGKARLVCKANKMTLEKQCNSGCKVVTGKIRAGREGPAFECR